MKHVKLFEGFEHESKGPFLVMYHNIGRSEEKPLQTFDDIEKAKDFVIKETLKDIRTYPSIDEWIEERTNGEITSEVDFLNMGPVEDYDYETWYSILANKDGSMKRILDQLQILYHHLKK
jgi:hypothetical protein